MNEDYFEIGNADVGTVCMEGTPEKCTVQIHAKPLDAVCICGAMTASCIETYFNLIKEADMPASVAWAPLKNAIKTAFENLGMKVTIDIEEM